VDEQIAHTILLGNEAKIRQRIEVLHLNLDGVEIVEPATSPRLPEYIKEFYSLAARRHRPVTRPSRRCSTTLRSAA